MVEAQKRLESIIGELRRETFGRKPEKFDPEQFNLPLEDVEVAQDVLETVQEKARNVLKGTGVESRVIVMMVPERRGGTVRF